MGSDACRRSRRGALEDLLDRGNTASGVWADTAYARQKTKRVGAAWLRIPHSPQEAERQANAHADRQSAEVKSSKCRRTIIRTRVTHGPTDTASQVPTYKTCCDPEYSSKSHSGYKKPRYSRYPAADRATSADNRAPSSSASSNGRRRCKPPTVHLSHALQYCT
jgi:hypothetical protein